MADKGTMLIEPQFLEETNVNPLWKMALNRSHSITTVYEKRQNKLKRAAQITDKGKRGHKSSIFELSVTDLNIVVLTTFKDIKCKTGNFSREP